MEAIGLNPIRLDAIGIDPIRLNAIRLGVPGASSGSVRPYIDPEVLASLVAVCICDGKSNNDPDRAIIKNLVDPDNPFVISNAAYKLNSGFGKYEADYSTWTKVTGVTSTPFGFKITEAISSDYWLVFLYNTTVPAHKVKVSGIPEGGELRYSSISVTLENGINELPEMEATSARGFTINLGTTQFSDWIGLSVEQIPSFQGALVTDGVDDMIVSQKSINEMLDESDEVTVVSMIHQITSGQTMTRTNFISGFGKTNDKWIDNRVSNIGKTGIYGYSYKGTNLTTINNILGDKNDYTSDTNIDASLSSGFSVSGYIKNNGQIHTNSSVAWYWTFIAKRALTTDEINQVIAYYNLDKYVKPDVYYDVKKQGLRNNTPDADWYLKDFSGNGRDMQLYNYAKTPESGINEEGALVFDGVEDYGQFVGDLGLKDYTIAVDRAYPSLNGNGVPVISSIKGNTVTPFLFEFADNTSVVRPYSFGATTVLSPMELSRKISYQSTYIYDGTAINKGVNGNTGNGLTIGRFGIDTQYANIALWSLLLFPYTLSEFLLERQLKRYKLGTLYPNMLEFRPIVKSNIPYKQIDYFIRRSGSYVRLNPGDYFSSTEDIIIRVTPIRDWQLDVISSIKVNGKDEVINVSSYTQTDPIHIDKSPQKIDITIDEYIRYEDIVQPYPINVNIRDNKTNKLYTYGDKIKVGTELKYVGFTNLLPELYKKIGDIKLNGKNFDSKHTVIIEKINVFTLTSPCKYLKANEPNCIADPQRLRIPNSSYKILGYIPDISGHGNHLKINNSAYAEMSGANGYPYNYNDLSVDIKYAKIINGEKVEFFGYNNCVTFCRRASSYKGKIKITGLNDAIASGKIRYLQVYTNSTTNNEASVFKADGTYDINVTGIGNSSTVYFYVIPNTSKSGTLDSPIYLEQIGKYEGSFCLDGVDDFITIPTLSHGAKQVLMKVNNQKLGTLIFDERINGTRMFINSQNDTIAYNGSDVCYIDGIRNLNIKTNDLLNVTHNITCSTTNTDMGTPVIGKYKAADNYYAKMALFTFMSFDDISSEEEIKELNDIVGIEGGYVESPDYYWDAYGKSNKPHEDIDYGILGQSVITRNRIFDKSVEGLKVIETGNVSDIVNRALTANNFAFSEESGYVDNGLVSDGVDDNLKNINMPVLTDYTWIMKRKRLNDKEGTSLCYKGNEKTNGAFLFEYREGGRMNTRSFGASTNVTFPDLISWQTKSSYNGQTTASGTSVDGNALHIFMGSNTYPYYTKAVFYKAMLYSKTIDMLSINMLKNLFERDELIDVNNPIFKQNN